MQSLQIESPCLRGRAEGAGGSYFSIGGVGYQAQVRPGDQLRVRLRCGTSVQLRTYTVNAETNLHAKEHLQYASAERNSSGREKISNIYSLLVNGA